MKNLFKLAIVLVINIFIFSGCSIVDERSKSGIETPLNNSLEISGAWKAEIHTVLEGGIISEEDKKIITDNNIVIDNDKIIIGKDSFGMVKYKLKIVQNDYIISYENKYSLSELITQEENLKVYTIVYQNKMLAEFYYNGEDASYLYYDGVIFKLSKTVNEISQLKEGEMTEIAQESTFSAVDNISEGLYLTLRNEGDGSIGGESYRTLWISTKNGVLQDVKEKDNIIVPRLKGIWYIEPVIYKDKNNNLDYQYFVSSQIESKTPQEVSSKGRDMNVNMLNNTYLHRKINFIGNDYIATEVTTNASVYKSNYYEVLPIDNLSSASGVPIDDLFRQSEIKINYQNSYKEALSEIDSNNTFKTSSTLDYSNYTLKRENGRWYIYGRISSVNSTDYQDFATDISPLKTLLNYDNLSLSWKVLKGLNPYMLDAYTSPNKSLAIVALKDELVIYKIVNGTILEEPLKRIPLEGNETIIMAEWCSSSYIDRWDNVFKTNSKVVE